MTLWTLVQAAHVGVAALSILLAGLLLRATWRDMRWAGNTLTPVEAEVLREKWFSAKALLGFSLFAGVSTTLQTQRPPFGEDWVWAVNGLALRAMLAWWILRRLRTRYRLRQLAQQEAS